MRPAFSRLPILAMALFALLLGQSTKAADLRYFDDAALNAVQFVDDQEGWAVGEDGVIWHTIDAGKNWERQPSGVRASLRSLHFINPYSGWVVGREEIPGGGSAGVLLYTADGGLKWKRLLVNSTPGLQVVRFVDSKVGYLAGDGADAYPSGVFTTVDGGRTWKPVPGPRAPAWMAGEFSGDGGVLAGAWNRLATVRREKVHMADVDALGGRSLRGLHLREKRAVAVGEGGLILTSETAGVSWNFVDLKLPEAVKANLDFHAVHGAGKHIWVVGRPGSVMLHSEDAGGTWRIQKIGQTMPLHGVHFRNDQVGWAVGELGTILATRDGGKSWTVQRRGGQRAAMLLVHARGTNLPMDALAWFGACEGYLTTALRVTSPDPATAAPIRACDAARFSGANRQAGGATGEMLWQFPLPSHLAPGEPEAIIKNWDRMHGDQAAEQVLRQLTLALRIWKPDVVVTDPLEIEKEQTANSHAVDQLVAEAVREAYRRAGDPTMFPEQLDALGLEAWKPTKLYCLAHRGKGHVSLDLTAVQPLLEASVAEFAAGPASLLAEASVSMPNQRHYRLVESSLADAAGHRDLMQGTNVAAGGLARRTVPLANEIGPDATKAIRQRANLRAMVEAPAKGLVDPNQLLAQIGPMLADVPEDHAVRSMHAVASHFARAGQWGLAREAYLLMADRYPAHPLTLEAYRWLVRHNSSSEARRRHELGQFMVMKQTELGIPTPGNDGPRTPFDPPKPTKKQSDAEKKGEVEQGTAARFTRTESQEKQAMHVLTNSAETRKWYQGALEIESRLTAFGPLFGNDPSLQFALAAARRNLGSFDEAKAFYQEFAARQPDGPWRSAALAELWLGNRSGTPPKALAMCRLADSRPYLDGKLDDECWQKAPILKLKPAGGDPLTDFATEVKLAYDKEFLYVAVRCAHPSDRFTPPTKIKQRDADLTGHDRVLLSFDLDRDYGTSFNLQVDQRGCAREDCWGDKSWDPRWFMAVQGSPSGWTMEAAIPLTTMTGDNMAPGRAWAFNVARVVPGRGTQAWSLPADGDELRPEGMGLLMFGPGGSETVRIPTVEPMQRVE